MRSSLILTVFAALGFAVPASAGYLYAGNYSEIRHCAAFGDPYCNNSGVDGPADSNYDPNATRGQSLASGITWSDPRVGTTSQMSASSSASFGALRGASSAAVSSQPPLGVNSPNLMRLFASGQASFHDTLTIIPADPTLLGQPGTYSATLHVSGSLDVGGTNANPNPAIHLFGYADWRLGVVSNGYEFGSSTGIVPGWSGYKFFYTNGTIELGNLHDGGLVPFTTPMVFGTPFALQVSFYTSSVALVDAATAVPVAQGITTGSGASNFTSTAAWNGIGEVKHGGQPVAFSVVSESGTDYSVPFSEADDDDDGVPNVADNCPFTSNPGQQDTGGIGVGSTADGIGDACQCGDVNGDGRVTLTDSVLITRSLLVPPTASPAKPELCDVGGSDGCSLADAVIVRRALLQPPTTTIQQVCAPAKP